MIYSHRNLSKFRTIGFRLILILTAITAIVYSLRDSYLFPNARAAATVQNSVPISSVSAASFIGSPASLAPNSIVAAFGTQLATGTQAATSQPLPTSLLNTTVTVNGIAAPIFFVSPGQVNYLIPPNTPAGDMQVEITSTHSNGDQIVSRGEMKISQTAPAIFTANSTGVGVPAAVTGRVDAGGQFVFDPNPPFEPDPINPNQLIPTPIDVGTSERPAFLILFGTGLRNAGAGSVRAIIGGIEVSVNPVVAPGFIGLDQINLPIPISLKGSGTVDVSVIANGFSSNSVIVNLAGTPNSALAITGFNVTSPALAGQTVIVQGSGFSNSPNDNIVRFGPAQARVVSSSATQLSVIVPFGAESGLVTVQTPQGEVRSNSTFRVRTSVSGIVQSTGSATTSPVPLEGVTIRMVGTNISVRTNPQGSFVLADPPSGISQIEVDGNTSTLDPPFPRVTLKTAVHADRDNQFSQPISLQQINGGSGTVGGGPSNPSGPEFAPDSSQFLAALKEQFPAPVDQLVAQPNPSPQKNTLISNRGVSLEIPIGAGVRFADGKTSGQMQLTVIERSRLPGINLPVGIFSSTIAQITPLGSVFSPGGSLTFPNPDQANLGPGAKVDLYRYDFQTGAFIKRGTATVSADRLRVVSDGRLVDLASFWCVAAPSGVTTARGRVIDTLGFPVPGAIVSINGRSDTSDQNGGFSIPDVATSGVAQIQAEAVLPQQFGTPPRGISSVTTVVAGGVTNVGAIALSNTKQPGLVLSPFVIDFGSNSPPAKVDLTLTQPAPSGGLRVTLTSSDTTIATVPAEVTIAADQTTASFNVTRAGGGVALIKARSTLSGNNLESTAVVAVKNQAPVLRGISPQAAAPGAIITLTGAGFNTTSNGNIIGLFRNNFLVGIITPQVVIDLSGGVSLKFEAPSISAGPVSIVAAVIDERLRLISDTSAPLGFNVLASDVLTPQLVNANPPQGKPRDQVTINGSNFSQNILENNVVFRQGFNEIRARILRATTTSLVVEVPSYGIGRGTATIVARRFSPTGARSNPSNALNFTVTAEPAAPVKPVLASVINTISNEASGQNGNIIRALGLGFGTNFITDNTGTLGNDDPLISLFLFYQNNQLVNYALPTGATAGIQLVGVVPTGLAAGPTQITIATFDLETGLISDESNPALFTITIGSLLRFDEDEPNDAPDTATKVYLQTIVDGRASQSDPGDLIVEFDNGEIETLHDLFSISLSAQTNISLELSFTSAADLDLFLLEAIPNTEGGYRIIDLSAESTGIDEKITSSLPAGKYLIAVGAYKGLSPYSLRLTSTQGVLTPLGGESSRKGFGRVPVAVRGRK